MNMSLITIIFYIIMDISIQGKLTMLLTGMWRSNFRDPLSHKKPRTKQTKTNKQANKKTYFKFQAYIFIYFPNWYIFFQEMHTIFSINIKNKLSFQSFDYSFFHETASWTLDRQMSLLINKISGEKKRLFIY
jgi:hypothetical protein